MANQDTDPALRAKVAPSDLVQETFLEAQRDFSRFHGETEEELLAWLRCILRNNLANARQHYEAQKRDVGREVRGADADVAAVPDSGESPSARTRAREQDEEVQRALQRLPERSRQAIVWHQWDGLTFAQVGERLGCSEEAARGIFRRALEELEELLEPPHDAP
jgi:RNA polymerase sigma-70 factor (ECF subfamily)